MNTITPFKGLELVVTVDDIENIRYLLDPNKEELQLLCDDCDGESFEIGALAEVVLDISVSKRYGQAILRGHEVKTLSAIRVLRCATCGSNDFVRDRLLKRGKDAKTNNSVGQSASKVRHC